MLLFEIHAETEFKKWFGASKIVDSTGAPIVMYHGTTAHIDDFDENSRGLYFVSPAPKWVSDFINQNGEMPDGANILPVYVSAANPFDYQNQAHVKKLAVKASLGSLALSQIRKGSWARLEDRTLISAIKALGHDGVYVSENGEKNLAVFSPKQIRSVFKR
jgi:hypothetical protein